MDNYPASLDITTNHPGRLAGGLLVLSLAVAILAAVILFASGAGSAFASGLQGNLVQQAPYNDVFRLTNGLYAAAWMILLLGFCLLGTLLLQVGSKQLPVIAIVLLGIAAILGVLDGTFHMSVTTWAAGETAVTGMVPAAYVALRSWSSMLKLFYMALAHLSLIVFGWAILRTELLPAGIGRAAVAWGAFWFLALVVLRIGFPALVFLMPPIIGFALLRR